MHSRHAAECCVYTSLKVESLKVESSNAQFSNACNGPQRLAKGDLLTSPLTFSYLLETLEAAVAFFCDDLCGLSQPNSNNVLESYCVLCSVVHGPYAYRF